MGAGDVPSGRVIGNGPYTREAAAVAAEGGSARGSVAVKEAWAGWRIVMLIADLEIRILDQDGNQLRQLTLDPTKDYQPIH